MSTENKNEPLTIEVVVNSKHGMHLRCCTEVARIASKFSCSIVLSNERRQSDARSVLGLATLAASFGSRVAITATGDDADAALTELTEFFGKEESE